MRLKAASNTIRFSFDCMQSGFQKSLDYVEFELISQQITIVLKTFLLHTVLICYDIISNNDIYNRELYFIALLNNFS